MKRLAVAALLSLALAPSWAGDAAVDPTRLVATLDGWRETPALVLRHCDEARAGGKDERQARFDAWTAKYAAQIEQVDRELPESIRLIVPKKDGLDPVRAIRAGIAMRRETNLFAGRSPDELSTICSNAARPDYIIWSEERAKQAQDMLAQLAAWRAGRAADAKP